LPGVARAFDDLDRVHDLPCNSRCPPALVAWIIAA